MVLTWMIGAWPGCFNNMGDPPFGIPFGFPLNQPGRGVGQQMTCQLTACGSGVDLGTGTEADCVAGAQAKCLGKEC